MTAEDKTYAYQRLLDWADDEDVNKPSTWAVFLSLTNNLEDDIEAHGLGYLEGDLLARALAAWSSDPRSLREFLEA